MIRYTLSADVDESASVEAIAVTLEQCAAQVRQMSSIRAAHSMSIMAPHAKGIENISHGTERNTGAGTPG